MNYYDGNTVTAHVELRPALRPQRQLVRHHVRAVRARGASTWCRATPAGSTPPTAVRGALTDGDTVADGTGGYSLIGDAQPYWDDCSSRDAVAMTGTNVGDLLNAKRPELGLVPGRLHPQHAVHRLARHGLDLQPAQRAGPGHLHHHTQRRRRPRAARGQWGTKGDYIPHHEPFQYYASTANPHHLAPKSLSVVGTDTATPGKFNTANHQYDLAPSTPWWRPSRTGKLSPSHLPAVSFLKAPGYQDGHAAYSDPIDEQQFVVREINSIEALPTWSSTAIVVAYDDSDGWYDHVYSGVDQPVADDGRRPDRHEPVRDRRRPTSSTSRAAAATVPACRCSGHLAVRQEQLRQQHPHRPVLDHQVRRRRTGLWVRSPARRPTSPARSTACSTSRPARPRPRH